MNTTHLTVEHVVVPSTQPYGATVQALEAQLGIWGNWDAIGLQLAEAGAPWQEVTLITEALTGTSGFTVMAKINLGGLLSRGQTPFLQARFTHDHLAAISRITPEGRLFMQTQERAYHSEDVVRFLRVRLAHDPWQAARHLGWRADPSRSAHQGLPACGSRQTAAAGAATRLRARPQPR